MRHAILVVVLIAASFLGGAFVNGPGLHWAQTRLPRMLGLSNGGEIASVDLTASADVRPGGSEPTNTVVDSTRSPSDTTPAPVAEDDFSEHDASARNLLPPPKFKPVATETPHSQLSAVSPPSPKKLSSGSRKTSAGPSAPLDSQVTPAILDSLAALMPSTPATPSPSSTRSSSPPKLVGGGTDEWTVLERKMQTLGVSRFTIEAEPGGHVVFSCLIPLAGRQAVAQCFQAEGDDIVQTAHTALRRIGLWRASQTPSK